MLRDEIREKLWNGVTITEICTEYRLTFKKLFDLLDTMDIKPQYLNLEEEHIYLKGKRYNIHKTVNGGTLDFGSYIYLGDAIKIRDELVALKWKANPLEYNGDVNIYIRDVDTYHIEHKKVYYGCYYDLEVAREVRDKLIEFNWDKDYLPLICKSVGVKLRGC